MLEKSFGLLFYLKKSKNQTKGPFYIYLKITVDGKSVELSSKRKWESSRWNSSAARALGTKEDARELNYLLDALELQIYQAKRSLIEADREVSAQAIKDILTGNTEKRKKIPEVFSVYWVSILRRVPCSVIIFSITTHGILLNGNMEQMTWISGTWIMNSFPNMPSG